MLKKIVYNANIKISKINLSPFVWGNISLIDRKKNVIAIKPSGIDVTCIESRDIPIVNIDGDIISGELKPSIDTAIHCILYKNFLNANSIVHTHSTWATIWSQIGSAIPILGTTHCDYFKTSIPCTRQLRKEEVSSKYEENIANTILEKFKNISYENTPAVLVHSHGPFTWGKDADAAVNSASILEYIAHLAWHTYFFRQNSIPDYLVDKHFYRKHGAEKYYGQA